MSDQPELCEWGSPIASAGAVGMYCTNMNCPVEKQLRREILAGMNAMRVVEAVTPKNATPGATPAGEDSVLSDSESSRPQGLLDEIAELKRIVLRTAKARDDYKDDYFRVHKDYMDFKYPGTRPKAEPPTRLEVGCQLKAHADAISELMNLLAKMNVSVAYDPTGKTREPPHCPSCECGLPGEAI